MSSQSIAPGKTYVSGCVETSNSCTFLNILQANTFCADLATKAGLNGKWVAWMTNTVLSAIDQVVPNSIADGDALDVYLIDKTTLVSGPVTKTISTAQSTAWGTKPNFASNTEQAGKHPDNHMEKIYLTEKGEPFEDNVWTGIDGTDYTASSTPKADCKAWSSGASDAQGAIGNAGSKNRNWHSSLLFSCDNTLPVYCLEVNQ